MFESDIDNVLLEKTYIQINQQLMQFNSKLIEIMQNFSRLIVERKSIASMLDDIKESQETASAHIRLLTDISGRLENLYIDNSFTDRAEEFPINLSEIGLLSRTRNALKWWGILTTLDLINYDIKELKLIHNFGRLSFKDLCDKLKRHCPNVKFKFMDKDW
jgi:DNA-directed RNA polymerase alpha subunit